MVPLTLRLPLQVTPEQKEILLETLRQYTESFNRVCQVGFSQHRLSGVALHHDTYETEREWTSLPSQLVCSARVKATEAVASVKTRLKKGKKASCPRSRSCAVRYDARSSLLRLPEGYATLATVSGRQKVSFQIPAFAKERANWKTCSCDLFLSRKGKLFLHVVVEAPEPELIPSGEVVGGDLGITRPAVTSQNHFFGARRMLALSERYISLRRILQAKGTKSAKRHLKKLRGKVNRFRKECDHLLSKQLLCGLNPGDTLVLEDLTDIRSRVKARKAQRRRLHNWSFARFQFFLEYKARLRGIRVVYVDPRYTSQKCSGCGHTEKGNRTNQSTFSCKKCGLRLNADLNAARNIRANHLASLTTRPGGGLFVNQPKVAGQSSQKLISWLQAPSL